MEQVIGPLMGAILRVLADATPGVHDTLIAACDRYRYEQLGAETYHDNCTDNLAAALKALGLTPPETPCPLNLFQNTPVVTNGEIGPLDGFVSAKTGNRFPSKIKIVKDEKNPGRKKAELDFGNKVDVNTLVPFWTDPKTGAELCEAPTSYVLRERDGDDWKEIFKVGRLMCQKEVTREQAIQLIKRGKTDLIEKFISKKGRPFDAYLVR